MKTTNLKVKLKNKAFILAGHKLFLNTENYCSLLLYICQNGFCYLCDSLDKFKNCCISDERGLTTYKSSYDSLLMLIMFLGLCIVWLWAIGNILEEHKDGGSVFHLNVDSTAYCQTVQNPQNRISIKQILWHWVYFCNDLPFSAADKDCLMNYKHVYMRSWYINHQFSWTDHLILLQ
jgi:hypothetical protein